MRDRISYTETNDELKIKIKALLDEKKQQLLLIWIVLFSICGILLFSQIFGDYEKTTLLFFCVYMAFWLFFEFKVIYAYRWRKYGVEEIILNKDQLILIKEIGKRGVTQQFEIDKIKKVEKFDGGENAFFKSMNTSYWNINKYSLSFKIEGNLIPFAIDLNDEESKKISKKIHQFLKNKPN
ncbi:hypothetical protein FRY74_00435 [Vicingus serpentipes]|uniref:Uncharacterized protein n=1 Tax=Vicingus serpentipes TaxID=1926625 RepID=A0A5C6RX63_9FLAO|nr:hypothetical protein [Vicingus serpentipes]TXB66684.1 hypothetical protein FRY74_00435 [Vicingus serpentipes]